MFDFIFSLVFRLDFIDERSTGKTTDRTTAWELSGCAVGPLSNVLLAPHLFVTVSVVDPFGDMVGVMYDRHHVEVLARR